MPLYISIRIEFYNGIVWFLCHSTPLYTARISCWSLISNGVITVPTVYVTDGRTDGQTTCNDAICKVFCLIHLLGAGLAQTS